MKRIALLTSSLSSGGAEKVLANLSIGLGENYEKTIILFDSKRIDYSFDGNIIELASKSKSNIIGKIITFTKRLLEVVSIKKKLRIQTTISFLDSPNLLNILSRKEDKVIISIRNYKSLNISNLYNRINNFFIKKIYNRADLIIAPSNLIKKDLIDNFNLREEKISVIYNPYDINAINIQSNEKMDEKYESIFNNPVIVNVGSLSKQKGQIHLIDMVAKIKIEIPNVKLIILGEGPLKEVLENKIKKMNLESTVYLLGFQKNPYKFVKKSDIFVFPSLYEGFPNALVEAIVCGTPVMSSDCKSGPREILAPDTDISYQTEIIEFAEYGILLPVIEKKSINKSVEIEIWSNAIINILQYEEMKLTYQQKNIKRGNDFNLKKIVDEWEKII